MNEYESKDVLLNADINTVYGFLSDFRNFSNLIPQQVKEWEATSDFCSFKAEGAGYVKLKYKTRSLNMIEIEPAMDLPMSGEVTLFVKLSNKLPKTMATVGANVSVPPMFKMMLSRPLKNLLDTISASLENYYNG